MKEIKFRARYKKEKWIYGTNDFNEIDINKNIRGLEYFFGLVEQNIIVDKKTLTQFIGIKDKNEKEIYEGDIVKSKLHRKNESGGLEFWKNIIGKIKYRFGGYAVLTKEEIPYLIENGCIDWGISSLEVIGNIFENKDLLKDKK